jgi:pantetheine-phosphate adenylyltransferase
LTTALYAGTFDPVTYGHLDVVRRAAALFDKVIVGVSVNPRKEPLFSPQERAEMLREVCQQFPNVEVAVVPGLVVDFARTVKAAVIVRGLRAVSDFEFELQMASTNRALAPEVETVFFTPAPQYHYVSASIVAEIARFGGNVAEFVPPHVALRLKERLAERFGRVTTAGSGPVPSAAEGPAQAPVQDPDGALQGPEGKPRGGRKERSPSKS